MLGKLFIFTKPAEPGKVKTRLIGDLKASETARLHQSFLQDVCAAASTAKVELGIAWALSADQEVPDGVGDRRIPGLRQQGDGLGERLFQALKTGAADGSSVAALGSDHPEITDETINSAFQLLTDEADVVLGPTPDGGYFLIGLKSAAVQERIFDEIQWSTDSVLSQTLERCKELGLKVELLPMGHDIDFPEDLAALIQRLQETGDASCVHTRAVLQNLGLLQHQERAQ